MSPERWKRIEELFDEAADLAASERIAFLDQHCAGDTSLRRELDVLLKAVEPAATFLGAVVGKVAGDAASGNSAEPGGRIGSYTILRQIGSGGMGAVYLAQRSDDQYHQQVAIKLIRPGMAQADVVRRFRAERQILANLQHANIARLLDGGMTESGAPYLVMEYVEGVPIDEYCRQRMLSLSARLDLIRSVCAAVHYAHQHLVIHRDIKPANILVTADGTPKLLDFGIAKLLRSESNAQTMALTRVAERLMTPEYASPEQVRGVAITTATDVYSLGIVLYELLTLRKPYRFDTRALYEMEKIICETEPAPPSSVAADGSALKGDLDNIVLMAMRKEPARRYASVADLSEDIQRFQSGYPVMARKATWLYSSGKFLRRNWLLAATFAAFLVIVLGLAARMTVLAARAEKERDSALQQRRTAGKVSEFLVDLFKVADPETARGKTITAREVLDTAAPRIAVDLKDQPAVQAELLDTVGKVYENLGDWPQSYSLLEQALTVRRRILPSPHPDLAQSLKDLSELARRQDDYAKAEALARESLDMRFKLYGEPHALVAETQNTLALALQAKGNLAEAEALFRRALAQRTLLASLPHLDTAILSNLGGVLNEEGRLAEAEQYLRECVEIRRKTLGPLHPRLALALGKLSNIIEQEGRYKEAEALALEGMEIRRKTLGEEHALFVGSLRSLGRIQFEMGRLPEAEDTLRRGLALAGRILGREHRDTSAIEGVLAHVLAAERKTKEAETLYRDALQHLRARLPLLHPLLIEPGLGLAKLLAASGRTAEARTLAQEALTIAREKRTGGDRQITEAIQVLKQLGPG